MPEPAQPRHFSILESIRFPIVLAPLGGGPSTPELTAAVSEAGGFAFLAAAYLSAEESAARIAETRRLTSEPFGVNVFSPVPGPADPAAYESYVAGLENWAVTHGSELGTPRFGDDEYSEKLALLESEPVDVVSFTFGCPETETIDRLHAVGSEVWVTVTNPAEAAEALAAGADVLIAQGVEAGGHRGSFADDSDTPAHSLLPLIQLVLAQHSAPLVASGGISTGSGVAAVLAAGASAAQIGTAFMLCPEAGTSEPHREAIASDVPTRQTRAFTGRTGRGIENEFLAEHDAEAPAAYPEIHYATAPLRRAARGSGDASSINLWAGEAHRLAREVPAAQLVEELCREARRSLDRCADRLSGAS